MIYLDHAATTFVLPDIVDVIKDDLTEETKDIDKPKFSGIYCIKNKVNKMI